MTAEDLAHAALKTTGGTLICRREAERLAFEAQEVHGVTYTPSPMTASPTLRGTMALAILQDTEDGQRLAIEETCIAQAYSHLLLAARTVLAGRFALGITADPDPETLAMFAGMHAVKASEVVAMPANKVQTHYPEAA